MDVTWCVSGGDEVGLEQRVDAAFQAWTEASRCAGETLVGVGLGACVEPSVADLTVVDGDPGADLEPGVPLATLVDATTEQRTVMLNDGMVWSSDQEIGAGTCDPPLWNLDWLLVHELGHAFGLPHVCGDDGGDACPDEVVDAVMAPYGFPCVGSSLTEIDRGLIHQAFGPVDLLRPTETWVGVAPFTRCVALTSFGVAADDVRVTWDFGDGGTAVGLEACHTWETDGTWEVAATLSYACGEDGVLPVAVVSLLPDGGADRPFGTEEAGCGCATGGRGAVGAVPVGLLLILRRRRAT